MTTKRVMSYEELMSYADGLSQLIFKHYSGYQLVAVARGGITVAHRVAYNLSKPLGFLVPAMPLDGLYTAPPAEVPAFFIEDLIAKGRTLSIIESLGRVKHIHPDWQFGAVVKDPSYVVPPNLVNKVTTLISPSEWIVFPYEDERRVQAGDWGLFREGTSQNSKQA